MKHTVIALTLNKVIDSEPKIPKGCIGFFYVFESKKSAREHCSKNIKLIKIEPEKPCPQ